MEYKLLSNRDGPLAAQVNKLLNEGWACQGGVTATICYIPINRECDIRLYQAMVKEASPNEHN
jgi:hypothetical protein